jgi:hypothetical protein
MLNEGIFRRISGKRKKEGRKEGRKERKSRVTVYWEVSLKVSYTLRHF